METQHQQGDLLFERVDEEVPESAVPAQRKNGRLEVMIGESTGHAHAICDPAVVGFKEVATDVHVTWLVIPETTSPARVVHEEHNTTVLDPGKWRVYRQQQVVADRMEYVHD